MSIGDIIICINNGEEGDTISRPMLTFNKSYIVIGVDNKFVIIKNDVNINYGYYSYRFISLVKGRMLKLERINSISE